MPVKLIMILFFCFVTCTFCANLMGGGWFTADQTTTMNQLTVFKDFQLLDTFSVPALNIDFFIYGIPKLVQWDYPFFGGQAEILRYFLLTLSVGCVVGILGILIGAVAGMFTRNMA